MMNKDKRYLISEVETAYKKWSKRTVACEGSIFAPFHHLFMLVLQTITHI